jgi:hypothetical protein
VKKSSGKANRSLTLQFNAVALRPIYCRPLSKAFNDGLNRLEVLTRKGRFGAIEPPNTDRERMPARDRRMMMRQAIARFSDRIDAESMIVSRCSVGRV